MNSKLWRTAVKRACASVGAGMALTALAMPLAWAAEIHVTTPLDTVAADGQCSLREAVANANDNAATHADCAAGTGADRIDFAANVTSIALSGGQMQLSDATSLQIDGGGLVTLDANAASRHFELMPAAQAQLTGLTLKNGRAAGGAAVIMGQNARLTVEDCTLRDNASTTDGGAIHNGAGQLAVLHSQFVRNSAGNNGGALHSTGTALAGGEPRLVVRDSTFTQNTAKTGAGILVWNGGLSVARSTLSENNSHEGGGGIAVNGPAPVVIENTTLHANTGSRGGGLYFIDVERTPPLSADAATQLYYLTLSDNLPDNLALDAGRVDLHWVLLTQEDSTARNCALSGGTVIQTSSNSLQWGGSSATSCSASPVQLDPLLGPLQDNGGLTLTRKPGAGSGARDRSSPCDRPEDQRGATRPNFDHLNCDSGAVEVGGAYLLQVAIGADNQGSVSAGDLPAPLSPGGIPATITDCADAAGLGNCVAFYSADPAVSTVTLTATPLPGFAFDHWEGPGCGTNPQTPQAQVRMSQSRACMAHFRVGQPVVTPVPTLGAWGLMLMALLAAGLGSARLRRRSM